MHFQLHIINLWTDPYQMSESWAKLYRHLKMRSIRTATFLSLSRYQKKEGLKKTSSCNRWESRKQVCLHIEVILGSVNKNFTNYIKVETERGHKTTLSAGMPDTAGHRLLPTTAAKACPQFLCTVRSTLHLNRDFYWGYTLFQNLPQKKNFRRWLG